jgi:hypothetical protein
MAQGDERLSKKRLSHFHCLLAISGAVPPSRSAIKFGQNRVKETAAADDKLR